MSAILAEPVAVPDINGTHVRRMSRGVGAATTPSPESSLRRFNRSMSVWGSSSVSKRDNLKEAGALMDWNERSKSPLQYAISEKSLATTTYASMSQSGMYRNKSLKQPLGANYPSASAAVQPSSRSQSLKLSVVKHEKQPTHQRMNSMSGFTQLHGGLAPQALPSASLINHTLKKQASVKKPPEMTMYEALNNLASTNEEVLISGINFIQNECLVKEKTRRLVYNFHVIEKLLQLLKSGSEEVQYAAAGALRNVVYTDSDNKTEVKNKDGLTVILEVLKNNFDKKILHQLAGLLWNLSSDDTIKELFNNGLLIIITKSILVPGSGLKASENPKDEMIADPKAFLCATACLRNLSSAGPILRRNMRKCENLIDSLVHYIRDTIANHKADDKSMEYCVCILQNLTYHAEEDFPSYNNINQNETQEYTAPKMSTFSCFPYRRSRLTKLRMIGRENSVHNYKEMDAEGAGVCSPLQENEDAHGAGLLWSKPIVRMYLSLVACSKNSLTRRAAIGALQNLTVGKGKISEAIAITIKEDGGLDEINKVLDKDFQLKNSAIALIRNLSRFPDLQPTISKKFLSGVLKMASSDSNTSNEMMPNLCRILGNLMKGNMESAKEIISHADFKKMLTSQHKSKAREAVKELLDTISMDKHLHKLLKTYIPSQNTKNHRGR